MDCKTCKEKVEPVPYIVYESAMARNERSIKRLFVALLIAIILLVASNGFWLFAWTQYDYSSEERYVEVDASDGIANYVGENGVINNGQDYSTDANTDTDQEGR